MQEVRPLFCAPLEKQTIIRELKKENDINPFKNIILYIILLCWVSKCCFQCEAGVHFYCLFSESLKYFVELWFLIYLIIGVADFSFLLLSMCLTRVRNQKTTTTNTMGCHLLGCHLLGFN